MKTIDQILRMIEDEKKIVIAVRGDNYLYECMDYCAASMHKEDCMDVSVELDGTCAFKLWEYGGDTDLDQIKERLDNIAQYVQGYGEYVHIIACDAGNYEYGWDEVPFGQEIIMRDAWVLTRIN